MKRLINLIIFVLVLFNYHHADAELISFKANDPAKADEVNNNFDYLLSLIESAQSVITEQSQSIGTLKNQLELDGHIYPVLSDGVEFGRARIYYSMDSFGSHVNVFFSHDFDNIYLNRDGTVRSYNIIYYKSNDCSGEAYIGIKPIDPNKDFFFVPKGKLVDINGDLYFFKKHSSAEKFIHKSYVYLFDGNCVQQANNTVQGAFIKLLPNNPAETGIQTYPIPNITIEGISEVQVN